MIQFVHPDSVCLPLFNLLQDSENTGCLLITCSLDGLFVHSQWWALCLLRARFQKPIFTTSWSVRISLIGEDYQADLPGGGCRSIQEKRECRMTQRKETWCQSIIFDKQLSLGCSMTQFRQGYLSFRDRGGNHCSCEMCFSMGRYNFTCQLVADFCSLVYSVYNMLGW